MERPHKTTGPSNGMKVSSTHVFKNMSIDMFIASEQQIPGIIMPNECHSSIVCRVEDGAEDINNCDGLFTSNPDLVLGIYTADCIPICIADRTSVGIVHAGWRGLCSGIVEEGMRYFNKEELEIFVGPHISSFSIQRDFCYEAVVQKFGEQFLTITDSGIIFRFSEAVASCLPSHAIFDGRDTFTNTILPSWRREKITERLITTVQCKK